MKTLTEIADQVHANAISKGFHPTGQSLREFMANQCNNLHGEVSELWEAWRKGNELSKCDKLSTNLNCTEEELADIIIRALDLSKRLGINIQNAVEKKHEYNLSRPYMHGKLN